MGIPLHREAEIKEEKIEGGGGILLKEQLCGFDRPALILHRSRPRNGRVFIPPLGLQLFCG